MSLEAITWAYKTEVGSPTRKAVLLVLANYADAQDASSYPSRGHIEKMTELKTTAVKDALRDLEAMGVIAKEPRLRYDGSSSANRYKINLSWAQGGRETTPPPSTDDPQGSGDDPRTDTKSIREETTKNPSRASRRDVSRPERPARQPRKLIDMGEELEAAGRMLADADETPAPRANLRLLKPPRRWSTTTLVASFTDRALAADTVPPAARDTNRGALGRTLKKWQAEDTASANDIAAAMDLFFVAPATRLLGEATLWLAFVNHYATIAQSTTRTRTTSDNDMEPPVNTLAARYGK